MSAKLASVIAAAAMAAAAHAAQAQNQALDPAQTSGPGSAEELQQAQMWSGDCFGRGPGWMGQGGGWMGQGGGWMGQGGGWMGQGMGPGWGRGPGRMGRGADLDADGDGLISAGEASAHAEEMFTLFDLDGDDAVSQDEFMESAPPHLRMRPWGAGGQRAFRHRAERFKSFDADEDGAATRAEFFQAIESAFEGADADGDGQVTVWEWRAHRRPW